MRLEFLRATRIHWRVFWASHCVETAPDYWPFSNPGEHLSIIWPTTQFDLARHILLSLLSLCRIDKNYRCFGRSCRLRLRGGI